MSTRRFRPAFTLIELLVVISIIALLISMLLPALGRSRVVTRTTLCLSNLKQLAIANEVYMNDWEYLPPTTNWGWTNTPKVQRAPSHQLHESGYLASREGTYCPALEEEAGEFAIPPYYGGNDWLV